eukprot:CAMPEP_0170582054 /NCGR_PEP_ID=MMETSP0224-20130122/7374_1 /TAXON_ID=285029 /ORGANISM="Togula jolla, Strain CCCM 725" /LENGTH=74 /DNA_ID=CAMNT_0010905243 /DNA_START=439 /DNA_END=663 /DNA_ORIENTATION=-
MNTSALDSIRNDRQHSVRVEELDVTRTSSAASSIFFDLGIHSMKGHRAPTGDPAELAKAHSNSWVSTKVGREHV